MKAEIAVERRQSAGSTPYEQKFQYDLQDGMSLLNVFELIEKGDPSFHFSHCCDNACCGICGVMCNSKPGLACRIKAEPAMRVTPLKNLPVFSDLVCNRESYDAQRTPSMLSSFPLNRIQGTICRMSLDAQENVKTAARCIECLCCLTVCPVFSQRCDTFGGPCHFALIASRCLDPRDNTDRHSQLVQMGIDHCVLCGKCSSVCPAGADPAHLISLLKEKL